MLQVAHVFTQMAESGGSTWALVIRDDGEASVVPLSDVPTLQAAEEVAGTAEDNPTFIVLHAQVRQFLFTNFVVWLGNVIVDILSFPSSFSDGVFMKQ